MRTIYDTRCGILESMLNDSSSKNAGTELFEWLIDRNSLMNVHIDDHRNKKKKN